MINIEGLHYSSEAEDLNFCPPELVRRIPMRDMDHLTQDAGDWINPNAYFEATPESLSDFSRSLYGANQRSRSDLTASWDLAGEKMSD